MTGQAIGTNECGPISVSREPVHDKLAATLEQVEQTRIASRALETRHDLRIFCRGLDQDAIPSLLLPSTISQIAMRDSDSRSSVGGSNLAITLS